ncbi:MAG TPA: PatB family C-S lyase [Steroidobacter sp.]|jgi:cystathionine beta-lyase
MSASQVVTPRLAVLRSRRGRKWSRVGGDVLPAWIADMDFLPAPPIRQTLLEAIETGDLGYGPTGAASGVPESFASWAQRRWQWRIDPASVLVMPDVVGGLYNCIEALTEPGDAVVVQTPVYGPFLTSVRRSSRRLVTSDSIAAEIDSDALDRALAGTRMLLLCNPHNPTGRTLSRAELTRVAQLAAKHDVLVVSDEVHADLVYPGHEHIPFASLGEDVASRTVTLNSASKAFNVAGLRCAVCVAGSERLQRKLTSLPPQRWTPFSTLGIRATLAAWTEEGERWLQACVATLRARRDQVIEQLSLPGLPIRCSPPQASYLAWLDCRGLALDVEPADYFLERARVALSPGLEFGEAGRGHARLNFATSEEVLGRLLDRMIETCAGSSRASGSVSSVDSK